MKGLAAKDIMSRDVLEVRSDWSLQSLAEFLVENCISGAPVISESGNLIGVVSLTDLITHEAVLEKDRETGGHHEYYIHSLEKQLSPQEIESLHFGNEPSITVRDIMTPKIFSVNEDLPIRDVADSMIRNHIHRIFVTREGKVLGIISAADMLKIIRDM